MYVCMYVCVSLVCVSCRRNIDDDIYFDISEGCFAEYDLLTSWRKIGRNIVQSITFNSVKLMAHYGYFFFTNLRIYEEIFAG